MTVNVNLPGLVRTHYKSVQKLSENLGWSYSKTYRIVTGRQIPNVVEVWEMADALRLDTAEEIKDVFLSPYLSTKENGGAF